MDRAALRAVALRVAALALLLALTLVAVLTVRTVQRLPDARIYFVQAHDASFGLRPVARRLGTRDPAGYAAEAVRVLAAGPSEAERARGLASEVPTGTEVLSARLRRGGVLEVDLSAHLHQGGGSASMRGRLEQLRWTLAQPGSVHAVELRVEGERLFVLGGEGLVVEPRWSPPEDGRTPRW